MKEEERGGRRKEWKEAVEGGFRGEVGGKEERMKGRWIGIWRKGKKDEGEKEKGGRGQRKI